jgi:hypothetical protein
MSQTKSQLIEGSAASELTAAKTLLGAGSAGAPSLTATGDTNTGIFFPTADTIAFAEGGVETVRIDSSGRVGIGTTSANTSIDVRTISTTAYSASNLSAYTGAYISNDGTGGFANITLNAADATGNSNCITAISAISESSGTRNSALAFATRTHSTGNIVERARIDSSGRLLVGTSSAFTTAGFGTPNNQFVGDYQQSSILLRNNANDNTTCGLIFQKTRSTSIVQQNDSIGWIAFNGYDGVTDRPGASIYAAIDGTPGSGDLPSRLVFSTTADGASSPTERMRITQSGRFGFGNIDPSYFADLRTASNARFVVHNSGTGLPMLGFADSGSNYQDGRIDAYSLNIVTGSGSLFGGSTGVRLANGATSWSSLSDERQKTSLTPIEDGLSKVAGLRAVTGRYLTDDPDKSRSFLIAQDVQAVLPEAVLVEDNEDQTLSLRYTEVIPLLVAALKESKERIEALEADVAQLKAS